MKYEKIPIVTKHGRPFWSVMIPVRNNPSFLKDALNSVLANDIPENDMQIEVVDNSTIACGIEQIVKTIGKGRINYFKQQFDLSMVENWNSCIKRSLGIFVHILHDDDYVDEKFYHVFRLFIDKNPSYGLYCCNTILINENKQYLSLAHPSALLSDKPLLENLLLKDNTIFTPGVVVKRKSYETLGGFSDQFYYATDLEMWIRIIANSGGKLINDNLAYYRSSTVT